MAKKLDPKNLTVDISKIKRLSIPERVELFDKYGAQFYSLLSPSQLANLFPSYFRRTQPEAGKAAPDAPNSTSPSTTATPQQSLPPKPRSKAASSPDVSVDNEFLKFLDRSIGGKPTPSLPATSGVGIDRGKFKSELESNPQVMSQLMSLAKAEVGGQGPAAQQKWMETVFNRAYAQGKSIAAVIDPNNGYWPRGQKRPQLSEAELEAYRQTLHKVIAGSNESNFATDNASSDLAKRREASGRKGHWVNGEFFYTDFHYVKAMERLRAETEARAATRQEASKSEPTQERQSQSSAMTGLRPKTPAQVTPENSKDIIAKAAKGDRSIGDRILDRALQLEGMNEIENRRTIQKYLKNGGRGVDPALTPWCADFVNATLSQEGIRGTGSAVATSFSAWGKPVEAANIQRGDVVVQHRGKLPGVPGGHVAFATGNVRTNPRTGRLEVEMYGGNQYVAGRGSIAANRQWKDVSQLHIRRAPDVEQIQNNMSSLLSGLNDNLRKYVEKQPQHVQSQILEKIQQATQTGINVNEIFNKWVAEGGNPNAIRATATPVRNPVPGAITPSFNINDPLNSVGNVNPADPNAPQYNVWQDKKPGTIPSQRERQEVFSRGGVVVNLDTNWARRGVQTGPLVVIPDNATEEQRSAAHAYVKQIEQTYREQFGKSLPGRVLTRSQNGRGRTATMHTEPFSVNDDRAVDYFTKTEEGRKRLAQITSNTIGRIPGVNFSEPHDVYNKRRPDVGAVAQRDRSITEVALARTLLDDMRNMRQQPEQQRTPTQTGTPPDQMIRQDPRTTGDTRVSGLRPPVQPLAAPATAPTTAPTTAPATPQAPAPAAPATAPASAQAIQPPSPQMPPQPPAAAPTAPPRQQDQIKPHSTGGQVATSENILMSDTRTGTPLGTVSPGEVVSLNQNGSIGEVKPVRRVSDIAEIHQPQNQPAPAPEQQESLVPEQDQQQTPQAMAEMRQTVSPPGPSAAEVFADALEPLSPNSSMERAFRQANFQGRNHISLGSSKTPIYT